MPLSAVCGCSLNIFAATLDIGGHYSIGNLKTCQAVVIGTSLSHMVLGGRRWLNMIVLNMQPPTEEKCDASKAVLKRN
jgi:hypothetical protein